MGISLHVREPTPGPAVKQVCALDKRSHLLKKTGAAEGRDLEQHMAYSPDTLPVRGSTRWIRVQAKQVTV